MEEQKKTREIDIVGLVAKVLKEKKLLAIYLCVSAAIGVVVALSTPKEYTSEVMLAPEMSAGGIGLSGNLADMAANFGIELGGKSSMDAIYPELYPDIFSSTDFIMDLFDVPVRLKDDDQTRTYEDHITKDFKYPFWTYPKAWLIELLKEKDSGKANGKGAIDKYKISKDESDICGTIRGLILCNIDKKTSVINIRVTDQDPLVASIVADTLQNRLQEYITEYRTNKARTDYEYYHKLTEKAKQDYEKARQRYGGMADASTSVALRSVEMKLEDMENDMQIKFNTYSSLNTQLQTAKAKVQERTPAFKIIQRPIMPHKASSTPRAFIVLTFMFLGAILDAIWVLYGNQLLTLFRKRK